MVKAIRVPGEGSRPRRFFDDAEKLVKEHGAKGLAWLAVTEDGVKGSIAQFVTDERINFATARVGNPDTPGTRAIIDKLSGSGDPVTPAELVDGVLDLAGPVEVPGKVMRVE